MDEEELKALEIRQGQIIKLASKLFETYVQANGLEHASCIEHDPRAFMSWFQTFKMTLDKWEICQSLDIPVEIFEEFERMAEDVFGVNQLMGHWYQIMLCRRPDPKHKVESINLMMLVTWEDGRMTPISLFCPSMISSHGLNDANVATFLTTRSPEVVAMLVDEGLDGLHKRSHDVGGERIFEILMGGMLQVVPQFKQEYREQITNLIRTCQGMLRPPIPAAMIQAAEAQRARERVQASGQKPVQDELQGGWDTGSD